MEWVSLTQVWGVCELLEQRTWTFYFVSLHYFLKLLVWSSVLVFIPVKHLVGRPFWDVKQNKAIDYFSLSCEKPTWFSLEKIITRYYTFFTVWRSFKKSLFFHSETFVDTLSFCTASLKTQRMDLYYVRRRLTSPLTHTICSILLWLISQFCRHSTQNQMVNIISSNHCTLIFFLLFNQSSTASQQCAVLSNSNKVKLCMDLPSDLSLVYPSF